jgi:DNA-binding FadR family transcriptional regulator
MRSVPPAARARTYLADRVYEALRRAILDREFDPGEPLTEQELSRRFKVSRTPVREALAKLERDQLVRVVPKKGPSSARSRTRRSGSSTRSARRASGSSGPAGHARPTSRCGPSARSSTATS